MSVTIEIPKRVGPNSWVYQWSSTIAGATFQVFRGGVRLFNTKRKMHKFDFRAGDSPAIEVRDGSEGTTNTANETGVILQWSQVSGASAYRVERYVGAAWVEVATVKARSDPQTYVSTLVADNTATQFRVTPIGLTGIAGTAGSVTVTIIRHPDPPNVAYTYNNGPHTVTVAAAA